MPTFRHGKLTVFKITDAAGTLRDISNTLRTVNFPNDADTAETSAFGTFDKTFVVGLVGHSISVDGMFDATVDGYLNGILALDIGGTYTGVFQYGPEGATSGRVRYTGVSLLTSYGRTSGIGDMAGVSANFQITGATTRDTWP